MKIVESYDGFNASHNDMPGAGKTMQVTGTVVFRTGGCTCELRRTEGPTGINDRMLSLDLVMTPPEGAATEVLTPCEVSWREDGVEIEYQQVEFRVVGTEDAPPPVIEVEHPV
jgi:hypothetical protein